MPCCHGHKGNMGFVDLVSSVDLNISSESLVTIIFVCLLIS